MRLKSYKKKTVGIYIARELIIVIGGIIVSILIINGYYKKFNMVIANLAEEMARKYISIIVNDVTSKIKIDDSLIRVEKKTNDEINLVTYDTGEATRIMNKINNSIRNKLDSNRYYLVGEIPAGTIFNNGLIRNMGPKIKLGFYVIGNVLTEISPEVKPYGINNALVSMNVKISIRIKMILPIDSKEINVTNTVPLAINVVNGRVPGVNIEQYLESS